MKESGVGNWCERGVGGLAGHPLQLKAPRIVCIYERMMLSDCSAPQDCTKKTTHSQRGLFGPTRSREEDDDRLFLHTPDLCGSRGFGAAGQLFHSGSCRPWGFGFFGLIGMTSIPDLIRFLHPALITILIISRRLKIIKHLC